MKATNKYFHHFNLLTAFLINDLKVSSLTSWFCLIFLSNPQNIRLTRNDGKKVANPQFEEAATRE